MTSCTRGKMHALFGICVLLGIAGAGLTYAHRVVALQIREAIRSAGEGSVRIGHVSGNLLDRVTVHELSFEGGRPDGTRFQLRLPRVHVQYDLLPILLGQRNLAPRSISIDSPVLEVQRRGPHIEIHRVLALLALLRQDLREVPIAIEGGRLLLSGDFPWTGVQTFELPESHLQWSEVGLAVRGALRWLGHEVEMRAGYEPESGLGHLRWAATRHYESEDPFTALSACSSRLETGPRTFPRSAFSGTLNGSGEVLISTRSDRAATSPDRQWLDVELAPDVRFSLAWEASLAVDGAQLELSGWPETVEVRSARLRWPSGSDGWWSARLGTLDGDVSLRGTLCPSALREGTFAARVEGLRPGLHPRLSALGPAPILDGVVEGAGSYPWRVRASFSGLAVPRFGGTAEGELTALASPEKVEIDALTLRAGAASAMGHAALDLLEGTYRAEADLQGLPVAWLEQLAGPRSLEGEGLGGRVRISGGLAPLSLAEGSFEARTDSLAVSGISAGGIRARGRFSGDTLWLDSLHGVGKGDLFRSIRLSAVLRSGRHPELRGKVSGLRLEGFTPLARGVVEAELAVTEERHEVHASVERFELPGAGIALPRVKLELVPEADAERLELEIPGRGHVTAAVLFGQGGERSLRAAGSFNLSDVAFLLPENGFLQGGRMRGNFRVRLGRDLPPEAEVNFSELELSSQRGPVRALGSVAAAYRRDRLVLSPGKLAVAGGEVGFRGVVGLAGGNWDFELTTRRLPVNLGGTGFAGVSALSGRLDSSFQLSGALERPTVIARVDLDRPVLGGGSGVSAAGAAGRTDVLDRVRGRLAYRNGTLRVEQLVLASAGRECEISGNVPLKLALSPFSLALDEAPVDLRIFFPPTPLSVASLFLPAIPLDADGIFQADVSVSGTPDAPKVQGLVIANARRISLGGLPHPLEDVDAQIVLNDASAAIRRFKARSGGASLSAEGAVSFGKGWTPRLEIDLRLEQPELSRRFLTVSNVEAQGRLQGIPGRLRFDGSVSAGKGVLDLAFFDQGGPSAFESIPAWLEYAVTARSRGNFWIRSSAINAELAGQLQVEGQGPRHKTGGELDAVRGQIYFQGNRFELERGALSYRTPPIADPTLFPWQLPEPAERKNSTSMLYVDARGVKRVGRTTLYMEVDGPVRRLDFRLRSLPPYDQDEILTILATRSDQNPAGADDQVVSRMIAAPLAATIDEQFLNRPVSAAIREATGLDEFRIDSNLLGPDRQGLLAPMISAGKYLSRNLFVTVDGQLGSDSSFLDHLGVEYQLERNLSVTLDKTLQARAIGEGISQTFDGDETKIGMEYRMRW